jgi:hypothetical protein
MPLMQQKSDRVSITAYAEASIAGNPCFLF